MGFRFAIHFVCSYNFFSTQKYNNPDNYANLSAFCIEVETIVIRVRSFLRSEEKNTDTGFFILKYSSTFVPSF